MLTKTFYNGTMPGAVELFEEEIPGEGFAILYGGNFDAVRMPDELGGNFAQITGRESLPYCPVCGLNGETMAARTDRLGPNGRPIAVVSCLIKQCYGWVELVEPI